MLLQLIRFTLQPSLTLSSLPLAQLRKHVSSAGASRQYLSYMTSTQSTSLPKKRHEICWIIRTNSRDAPFPSNVANPLYTCLVWRKDFTIANKPAVIGLDGIIQGEATTMLYDFDDAQLEQLTRGIEAPICEFVRSTALSSPSNKMSKLHTKSNL